MECEPKKWTFERRISPGMIVNAVTIIGFIFFLGIEYQKIADLQARFFKHEDGLAHTGAALRLTALEANQQTITDEIKRLNRNIEALVYATKN